MHARRHPDLDLQLVASVPLEGLVTTLTLHAGQRVELLLRWGGGAHRHRGTDADVRLRTTHDAWRRWTERIHYDGPQRELVRRSAITLKMLDCVHSGALVAAPTSSLPEAIGGRRNWDYRFAWVRDAAYGVYAFRSVGLHEEASAYLGWVLDAIERDGRPRVLYGLDGRPAPPERVDAELEGYRGSRPIRFGNAAADQTQHDVYGEILDCAWQWSSAGGSVATLWPALRELVEVAATRWREPDHGIWEVRTPGRVFTYSVAMCHVALERGARFVEQMGFAGDAARWRTEAARVRHAVLHEAWSERLGSLGDALHADAGLDASVLALPLRRIVDARHPRMVSTVDTIARELAAGDGLLFRYLPEQSPDGIDGREGAFVLCSFWLVDNLAAQGRLDEAHELYDALCGRASPLGLLSEEIDPTTGAFLGNFPQAFSHVGVISSGCNLAGAARRIEQA